MKKFLAPGLKVLLVVAFLSSLAVFAFAADTSIFPESIQNIIDILGPGGICATDYILTRARFALFMVLGGLVLISVVYALMAAFKYIRSEGDPGKMEDAQKSIKAIFFGIAAMIIAIFGIVLVFVVFGAKPTNPDLFQVCLNGIDSEGCKACQKNKDSALCVRCENMYADICAESSGKKVTVEDAFAKLPTECKSKAQ